MNSMRASFLLCLCGESRAYLSARGAAPKGFLGRVGNFFCVFRLNLVILHVVCLLLCRRIFLRITINQ